MRIKKGEKIVDEIFLHVKIIKSIKEKACIFMKNIKGIDIGFFLKKKIRMLFLVCEVALLGPQVVLCTPKSYP